MMATYTGPIIDAHHHLWDLRLGKHPWLAPVATDDGVQELRRNFLAADYAPLAAAAGITASVHVEANWDPADPVGEDAWLDGLDRPAGIAARYVAYAPLGDPHAAAILEGHAAHRRVTGIREILSWHPEPAKRRMPDNDRFGDSLWRANLARLRLYDFSFDLLLSPWQLADARRLADDFPDLSFILNHCGSPMDRDPEGMRHWREQLHHLAGAPNVSLKISDPVAYDPQWTIESLTDVIRTSIDAFGPGRSMFASDYPVAGLHIGFAEWLAVFKAAIADLSQQEQAALLHDSAARLYRIAAMPA